MSAVERISLEEFQARLLAQNMPREHMAFQCPMCETIQSAYSLIKAGAGQTFEDVEGYLGFSCVGRWKHRGKSSPHPRNKGKGCNWTLGGLFQLHQLEVVDEEGDVHPRFTPATPEEAETLAASWGV